MAAPRYEYRAIRTILHNGARAYNVGDLVPGSAVEGDAAWLTLGEDVEPTGDLPLDRPARNASQAAWVAYAVSRGMGRDEAEGMSRADLVKATQDF
ncbi:MAG TPA: hypothetical protein VIV12_11765 [Streptosporangiaceae bacterium]